MTEPKTKYPIESFGPELMAALVKGGLGRVVIPFPEPEGVGKKKAHSFQRRIHTLRQRMRSANHPQYMIAARAKVSIFWGERAVAEGGPKDWADDYDGKCGALIVIAPHDSEFKGILNSAGIEASAIEENLPPPLAEPEPALKPSVLTDAEKETFDDFLDGIWPNSTPKEPAGET